MNIWKKIRKKISKDCEKYFLKEKESKKKHHMVDEPRFELGASS